MVTFSCLVTCQTQFNPAVAPLRDQGCDLQPPGSWHCAAVTRSLSGLEMPPGFHRGAESEQVPARAALLEPILLPLPQPRHSARPS